MSLFPVSFFVAVADLCVKKEEKITKNDTIRARIKPCTKKVEAEDEDEDEDEEEEEEKRQVTGEKQKSKRVNLTFGDSLCPKRKLSEHLLLNRQERHWLVWIRRNESIVRHRYQPQLQHPLVRIDCRSILVPVLDTSISLKRYHPRLSNQISFSFDTFFLRPLAYSLLSNLFYLVRNG